MCTFDGQMYYPFVSRAWIGESGASCFTAHDPTGMLDKELINESVEATNRSSLTSALSKDGALGSDDQNSIVIKQDVKKIVFY